MIVFGQFGGLSYEKNIPLSIRTSMGNMGFSKSICSRSQITTGETNLYFQCEGTTMITRVFSSGIASLNDSYNTLLTC